MGLWGCGVRLAYRAEGEVLPWHVRCGGPSTMKTIVTLMYADDIVLMSCDRVELEMLQVFDSVDMQQNGHECQCSNNPAYGGVS